MVKDGTKTSDLLWFTTDRMEWHMQVCKGEAPSPRDNHCMGYDETRNRLVIFGGRNAEKRRLNDVYYLELDSWTWSKPHVEGTPPSTRELASSVMWQGHMLVFGAGIRGFGGFCATGITSWELKGYYFSY